MKIVAFDFADRIRPYFDPGKARVVFDMGAHNGSDSIELAKAFPGAMVYSLEANPVILPNTYASSCFDLRIRVVPVAASERTGFCTFYITEAYGYGASSLFRFNQDDPCVKGGIHKDQQAITVSCLRSDEWCNLFGVGCVDVLWMDLQGAELMALRGLGKLLETVKAIRIEVELREYYIGQPLYAEVDAFLVSRGFRQVHVDAFKEGDLDTNAIYVQVPSIPK